MAELLARVIGGAGRSHNWAQLVRFGVVGASGYAINLAVFALLAEGAGLHHIPSAIGAFCVAVSNNFHFNRVWTFAGAEGTVGFQAPRFLSVSVFALGVNLAVLEALVSAAAIAELPAQAIAVAVATPINFVGNKLWTFS